MSQLTRLWPVQKQREFSLFSTPTNNEETFCQLYKRVSETVRTINRSCVLTYTSKLKINRYLQKCHPCLSETPPQKRTQRSLVIMNSAFSGHICIKEQNSKNPGRWRPVSRCRAIHSGPGDKTLRDTILQMCHERNDQWAKNVELRVLGAVSD